MKIWLKYIVEAFVIVLSILAAFWLEDWGEQRNQEEKHKLLLVNLNSELSLQYEYIQNASNVLLTQQEQLKYLINYWGNWQFESDSLFEGIDKVTLYDRLTAFQWKISLSNSIYSSAIGDGSINLISNQKIKSSLDVIYGGAFNAYSIVEEEERQLNKYMKEYIIENYASVFAYGSIQETKRYFTPYSWQQNTIHEFFTQIEKDHKLKLVFHDKLNFLARRKAFLDLIMDRIQEVMEEIDNDITAQ